MSSCITSNDTHYNSMGATFPLCNTMPNLNINPASFNNGNEGIEHGLDDEDLLLLSLLDFDEQSNHQTSITKGNQNKHRTYSADAAKTKKMSMMAAMPSLPTITAGAIYKSSKSKLSKAPLPASPPPPRTCTPPVDFPTRSFTKVPSKSIGNNSKPIARDDHCTTVTKRRVSDEFERTSTGGNNNKKMKGNYEASLLLRKPMLPPNFFPSPMLINHLHSFPNNDKMIPITLPVNSSTKTAGTTPTARNSNMFPKSFRSPVDRSSTRRVSGQMSRNSRCGSASDSNRFNICNSPDEILFHHVDYNNYPSNSQ